MKIKTLAMSCLVLMFAVSILAQSGKTTSDPVSGNWGAPNGAGFDLKFDGKSVSGTIRIVVGGGSSTAPIESGTFDPKTSLLRIEGEAKSPNGNMYRWVIEGTVAKEEIAGTYKFDNNTGDFKFNRIAQ